MAETIFTKIINGDIPSYKVYSNDYVYAFMDINPIQPGHVLVATKKQVEAFEQLNETDYMELMKAVKKISEKIKKELKPQRVGVIIEGFDVPHVHVKILPINSEAELRHLPDPSDAPSKAELAQMARRLQIND